MRRNISLLAIMMLMALMVAASAIPAFAQGPPPDRPPEFQGPPEFAQGPPPGTLTIAACALRPGVGVITPSGQGGGACPPPPA